MVVDNDYNFTPYRTTDTNPMASKEAEGGRVYSDHKAILTSFKVNDKREKVEIKPTVIRDNEGWSNLYQETDLLADKLIEMINEGEKPERIFAVAEKGLKDAEYFPHYLRCCLSKYAAKFIPS